MQNIVPPSNCPSCASILDMVNHVLYCRNTYCPAQSTKKVEHFSKTLKIKGLGPSTIQKLGLTDIDEIYTLTQEEIVDCISSEKLAEKLYKEIENSKKVPLQVLLPAFSIPLIGKTAAEKLSTKANNLFDITESVCLEAGLGPKATESLLTWISKDFYCFYDGALPFSFEFEKTSARATETLGVVCITGKLKSFKTKALAQEALKNAGYQVKSSVTKEVTILVNESGQESAKTKQARQNGLTIVEDLHQLIGEN